MNLQSIFSKQFVLNHLLSLAYYMLVANILYLYLFSFNHLLYPEVFRSGPKIFQIFYTSPLLLVKMVSTITLIIWICENILFYKFMSSLSSGRRALFSISLTLTILFVFGTTVGFFYYQSIQIGGVVEYVLKIKNFMFNKTTLYFFMAGSIIDLIKFLGRIIYRKVGGEDFLKIVFGYYKKPREVNRIFIFIDLISSTRYAELLGHTKYSSFIQECFKEIGLLELEFSASQYQFVGDEVVLSWSADNLNNFQNAVDFYFKFARLLESRSRFFEDEFGLLPKFTASINSGLVMMVEVGVLKSEIAFHGDVLNTAARIQKYCKKINASVLATARFSKQLNANSNKYKITDLGFVELVGKKRMVQINDIYLH